MKKIITIFIVFISFFLIYILINFLFVYNKMTPFIDKTFQDIENLSNNQVLVEYNLDLKILGQNSKVNLDLMTNDTLEVHFLNFKSKTNYIADEVFQTKNYNSYVIYCDTNFVSNNEHHKNNNIFYLNKNKLPFRYKIFSDSYSIRVTRGKILKVSFNFFKDE